MTEDDFAALSNVTCLPLRAPRGPGAIPEPEGVQRRRFRTI